MLRPDKAEAGLAKFRSDAHLAARIDRVKKLPKAAREVGLALLERDLNGNVINNWEQRQKLQKHLDARLVGLSDKHRGELFAALFPKLTRHLDATWQQFQGLPYQLGYSRKSFRAPNHPAAVRGRRYAWLTQTLERLREFDPDIEWLATWAGYLHYRSSDDNSGYTLAAAISAGGPEGDRVYDILTQSAGNLHPVAAMGRHVTRALLVCDRPEAWTFVEKFLLAAQRQEGLRQVILETVDEAHPLAFRRMLKLIRDHDLARFSAVVRSVNVWFGFLWDSVSVGVVNAVIDKVGTLLDDPAARRAALKGGDAEDIYLALWALGFDDIDAVFPAAAPVLAKGGVGARYAAVTLLNHLGSPLGQPQFLAAMDDPDLRVARTAFRGAISYTPKPAAGADDEDGDDETAWTGRPVPDMFERIEALLARMPEKPQTLPPLVWPWATCDTGRENVGYHLPDFLGDRPAKRLLPHLPTLGQWQKVRAMEAMTKRKPLEADVRDMLFTLVRDPAGYVREKAVEAIAKLTLTSGDAEKLEVALTRSNSALRRGVLGVLAGQKAKDVDATADRLLGSANKNQRLAGLDLLVALADDGRGGEARRARGEAFRAARGKKLSDDEAEKLTTLARTVLPKPTLDDGLGLLNPAEMSVGTPPRKHDGFVFMSPAAAKIITALDALIDQHREHSYTVDANGKSEDRLLGANGFPQWDYNLSAAENAARLPLREVWEEWFAARKRDQRDADGMELYRAEQWLSNATTWAMNGWKEAARSSRGMKTAYDAFTGGQEEAKARYHFAVAGLIGWLRRLHPEAARPRWVIDATEAAFALVPKAELDRDPTADDFRDWRDIGLLGLWAIDLSHTYDDPDWTPELVRRYWGLLKWKETSVPQAKRRRTDTNLLLLAYRDGAANRTDLLDSLIGPRPKDSPRPGYYYSHGPDYSALSALTERRPNDVVKAFLKAHPEAAELVDRVTARVLKVELERSELATAASEPAQAIRSLRGADTLFALLRKLGKKRFERSPHGTGYPAVFSHLVQVTFPRDTDTPTAFAVQAKALLKEGQVPAERFLELAFFAPQWLPFVAAVFGWSGFEEGVYWFQAHAPGARHYEPPAPTEADADPAPVGERKKTGWDALVAERTALTDTERAEGAVDAAWFWRAFEPLGAKRWDLLAAAAKYAAGYGGGAKKAHFLGLVLRGKTTKRDLVRGIRDRQLKENVRCLGLLPLGGGAKREPDLLGRYKLLQAYLRYARSLGPMSREATVRTGHIGLENLARTAGYPDPIRLEWAMEAKTVADLKAGPLCRTAGGVTVTLSLDEKGLPETSFTRGEKELKSLPAAVRKDRKVADLIDRKADLRRQAARMKWSLEAAMIRGDTFTGTELRTIFEHPMLEPLLSRLVLVGEGIVGYPVKGGRGLEDHAGKVEPVKAGEKLRIAHCHDLYAAGAWHLWQADVFRRERVQPFKQVFRELYLVSAAETADHDKSARYDGQQVNPAQANALWGGRGWATKDEVRKRFHDAGVAAEVFFKYGYGTPMEVEGLTLDAVRFYRKDEWKPMPLADVPPRVFSEVMRDCDLVVSVAHRGGVDPEASQSTVEMRAALLRETCALLKLPNVRVQGPRALIDGELNNYALHLGSGVVHRMPGGSVCIVPVHAQHRGRIFLPFADDDPKTAEVVSKALLLARDAEIQDPTILDQLRVTV